MNNEHVQKYNQSLNLQIKALSKTCVNDCASLKNSFFNIGC